MKLEGKAAIVTGAGAGIGKAIAQLTRCLAMDLAPDHVRVNAICPDAIRTQATDRHIASLEMDREEAYREFGDAELRNCAIEQLCSGRRA